MHCDATLIKKKPKPMLVSFLSRFKTRIIALFAIMLFSMNVSAHGVQVGYTVLSNGFIRVYIEDWHPEVTTLADLQGNTINVTTTYGGVTVTQDVNASGIVNGVSWNNLPGAGSNIKILTQCPNLANQYNNWGYFDFAPAACGVPVTITINAGNTYIFEDACGSLYPATVHATFAYVAPVLTSPDINVSSCSAVAVHFTATAISACDPNPTVTYSVSSGTLFSVGSTPVTATATDSKGNAVHSIFHVIVTAPPITISPIANISVTNTPGKCGADVTYPTTVASGTPAPTMSYSIPSGSFFPVGTTTVIATATNNCTSTNASFTVTVASNESPTFAPPIIGTKTISIPNGQTPVSSWTPYSYSFLDPLPAGTVVTGTDLSYSGVDQGWGGQGFNIQLYVAGTMVANTQILHAKQNFNINYTGGIPAYVYGGSNTFQMNFVGYPGWQAFLTNATLTIHYQTSFQTTITVNNDAGKCGAVVALGTPNVADNCGVQSLTNNAPASSFFPLGTTIVSWTVKDVNNHSATITQSVTVTDHTLPVIATPAAITVSCGASLLPANTGMATATDNCNPNVVVTYKDDILSLNNCGGTITRTWTATAGTNVSTSIQTITVSPATLPIMVAPVGITVGCGGLPAPSIISFSNGLSGSCLISGASNASTFSAIPNACGGIVTETWTATGPCGRILASVSRVITVTPAAMPTMSALAPITVACGGLPAASSISFSNGLSGGCLISGTSNLSTFTATPAACGGTVTETWTATGPCGRVLASVSRVITVTAAALPIMVAPAPITITIPCGGLPVPSTIPFTNGLSDGCLISGTSNPSTFVTTPGTCGGTVTEFWTATDVCGRTIASVSRVLTVSQNLATIGDYIMYSGDGAVSNTGSSTLTGNVGARIGAISGFAAPTTVNGSIYAAASSDAIQANIDLLNLYLHLSNIPVTNTVHAPAFGSGETITTGVYTIASAGSLAGNLILDGQGNPNSVFVIRFNGAFSPAAGSSVTLTNGIRACNVFFIAEGAISIGATSVMKGTFIGHTGAVTMAAGGDLEGRLLSTVGAVTFGPGNATLPSGLSTIPIICVNACNNPILGSTANFALFTSAGAVSNTGSSGIIGNIGSDAGAITNFETPATTLVGTSYNANSVTAQAKTDLQAAYVQLAGMPATNSVHGVAFGSGETLLPGVYTVGAAGSLAGTLTLDGQGNPNAVFVFKFGGAFVTAAQSKVILTNGASHCNIFWVAEGAVSMGTFSTMKGTLIAHNGANTMGAYGNLEGRMFSTAGAIGFSTGVAYISYSLCGNPAPVATTTGVTAASALSAGLMTLQEDRLSIYPNPSNGVLHLDYSGDVSKVRSIDVCDMLGKKVFSADHYQPLIVLTNKVTGVYFVRVHLDTKVITYKIIVNK